MPSSNAIFGNHNILSLHGSGKIDVSSDAAYTTSHFTVEAWVRTNMGGCVFAALDATGNSTIYSLFIAKNGDVSIKLNDTLFNTTQVSALTDDRWYHLGITYNSLTIDLYISGVLVQSFPNAHSGEFAVGSLTIGSEGTKNYFSGNIIGLHYWNTARTALEIKEGQYLLNPPITEGLIGA